MGNEPLAHKPAHLLLSAEDAKFAKSQIPRVQSLWGLRGGLGSCLSANPRGVVLGVRGRDASEASCATAGPALEGQHLAWAPAVTGQMS